MDFSLLERLVLIPISMKASLYSQYLKEAFL